MNSNGRKYYAGIRGPLNAGPSGRFTREDQAYQPAFPARVLGVGGAGGAAGGGGGGGAVEDVPVFWLKRGDSITVTIGAGGAGVDYTQLGNPGSYSAFGPLKWPGGGRGGFSVSSSLNLRSGGDGGSGGGAGYQNAGTRYGGASLSGLGNVGGDSFTAVSKYPTGGGGGAGGTGGTPASDLLAGNGGAALSSDISGSTLWYGGGGGGGTLVSGGGATAGTGGTNAGNGAVGSASGTNGAANKGGGGGGGGVPTQGSGGSGVVVVRYAGPQRATGGTVTTSGNDTIHTFTSSGTFTVTG